MIQQQQGNFRLYCVSTSALSSESKAALSLNRAVRTGIAVFRTHTCLLPACTMQTGQVAGCEARSQFALQCPSSLLEFLTTHTPSKLHERGRQYSGSFPSTLRMFFHPSPKALAMKAEGATKKKNGKMPLNQEVGGNEMMQVCQYLGQVLECRTEIPKRKRVRIPEGQFSP